jgi:hypothetical protein
MSSPGVSELETRQLGSLGSVKIEVDLWSDQLMEVGETG